MYNCTVDGNLVDGEFGDWQCKFKLLIDCLKSNDCDADALPSNAVQKHTSDDIWTGVYPMATSIENSIRIKRAIPYNSWTYADGNKYNVFVEFALPGFHKEEIEVTVNEKHV